MTKPSTLPRFLRALAPLSLAVAAVCSMPARADALISPFTIHAWSDGYFSNLRDVQAFGDVVVLYPIPDPMPATHTMSIAAGGAKYLDVSWTSSGQIFASDNISLWYNNTLTNHGVYDLQGDVGIGSYHYGNAINTDGILRKSAGLGVSTIAVQSNLGAAGLLDVQTGTVNFTGGASFESGASTQTVAGSVVRFSGGTLSVAGGTSWLGAGQVQVATDATIAGNFGAEHLLFMSGIYTGGNAVLDRATLSSDAVWRDSGSFAGTWVVAHGSTLTVESGGNKYVRGAIVNQGTVKAQGDVSLWYYNSIDNQGLYDLQGDVGLGTYYYGNQVVNSGTLRKSAGAGASVVATSFSNNGGTIDVQSGAINFQSGSAYFGHGSRFTGAGQAVVSIGAIFDGDIHGTSLVLSNGSFQGGIASAGSAANVTGQVQVRGSASLTGTWQMAAGSVMTVDDTGAKYLQGSLDNQGQINARGSISLWYYNVLTNRGVYDLQGDVGIGSYYYGNAMVNHGVLRKSQGTGTSTIDVAFSNTASGTVQVDEGRLQFAAGPLVSEGLLKGRGVIGASSMTNLGHVAPGASPGTLTIDGNYVQGGIGSLDIELDSTTSFDKLVVTGSASLDGALNLICFGGCQLALGDTFTVLDAADGALSGTFASLSLSNLRDAEFAVVYDYDHGDVLVKVTRGNVTAVPEPEGWALALAGLSVAALLSRRRKGSLA
jgi:MYXO-CTERM domain-containing protein